MGENVIYKGETVQIGTCENMYRLRADQADLVSKAPNSLDVAACRESIRFRFPFPDEDGVEPGDFKDWDRSVGLHGVFPPDGVEHGKVQFTATGYNVMLPCPESGRAVVLADELDLIGPLEVRRNGFAGNSHIVQQRWLGDLLVLVMRCGGCGVKYRLPTFADAEPVVVYCRSQADVHAAAGGASDSQALWWSTVADRITAGYVGQVAA